MNQTAIVAALLATSTALNAATPVGGTWSNVIVASVTVCTAARCPPKGWVTVQLSTAATGNPPQCSADNRNAVAVDLSTVAGAMAAGMLQTASLAGMSVTMTGAGKCDVDSAIETLATVVSSSERFGGRVSSHP
jgi:hypothetical protein